MPLVRVEVRNEYGLGMPELYTETNREDPKAVLDAVAVAGLVGILRQLGDLAEFAAEVFHGIQEQVLITSSRSHKLVERVHNIEVALPSLEKAILAQRSHLHFAYTAGSHWHARVRTEQNHFIYSDLPRCIMDSYEDCRDPPRLHKLDKFDIGGPGACFKRYSDPTYFKRTSAGPYEAHLQSLPREKKARRTKKKKSSSRHRDKTHGAPKIVHAGRTDFDFSNFQQKTSPSQEDPITFKNVLQQPETEPEIENHITSFDSRNGSDYIECIFRPSYSTQSEDNNNVKEPTSASNLNHNSYLDSASIDENVHDSYLEDHNSRSRSSYITWDEKLEIIDSTGQPNDLTPEISSKIDKEEEEEEEEDVVNQIDHPPSVTVAGPPDEIESETDYYMDALNTIESESETDVDCHTKRELQQVSNLNNKDVEEIHNIEDANSTNFEFQVPEHSSHMDACSSLMNEIHEELTKSTSPPPVAAPKKVEPEEIERNDASLESPIPLLSTSDAFWTNGGLLGLEPSKPPDFGLPTTAEPGPMEESRTENNGNDAKEDSVVNGQIPESGKHPNEEDPMVTNSSRIFEFSNRLLVNGFRKQLTLVGNEKLASSVKTEVPDNPVIQKGYQTVTGIPFREQFGNGSHPFISPASPPLEQMRISFQPIDGFKTSKLKLTIPDGNDNTESSRHMFPSFQLVPETTVSLHKSGSDSDDYDDDDDDTFCRSSPYASDHSNQSESNSDQWDSSDSPRIKDCELESVSSSFMNGIQFQNDNYAEDSLLLDIPNFDSMNVSHKKVADNFDSMNVSHKKVADDFDCMNVSHKKVVDDFDSADPTPPPPPLPPMEWRGVKPPHSGETMEKEDGLSEALTFALNLTTTPEPVVLQQSTPAPIKQDCLVETRPEWETRHIQNEPNRTTNWKVGEEKDDFLQQIRTKSLNLRRTSTARANTTPAGPTSGKVTAILEKANAIRQVVGSDDGEDDNWSDT